jgi:hypothetical protein
MVKQYIWLYTHKFLTGRCFFEVGLQLSAVQGMSYRPLFLQDKFTTAYYRRNILQMLHF